MPDITGEAVEKAARAHAESDGYDWSEVSSFWQERYRSVARAVLSAALAGCTVVDLPEADDTVTFTNRHGDQQQAAWSGPDDYGLIYPIVWRPPLFNHEPHVETPSRSFSADDAERLGLQLISAAREARRLAGSVSPKGDDTNE